jgi:hypothetical protein
VPGVTLVTAAHLVPLLRSKSTSLPQLKAPVDSLNLYDLLYCFCYMVRTEPDTPLGAKQDSWGPNIIQAAHHGLTRWGQTVLHTHNGYQKTKSPGPNVLLITPTLPMIQSGQAVCPHLPHCISGKNCRY